MDKAWKVVAGAAILALATPAAGQTVKPGLWEYSGTMLNVDMPDASPAMTQALSGRTTSVKSCLTPQQAKSGPRVLFDQSGGKCAFSKFAMAKGKIDTTMSCKGSGGPTGDSTITTTGSYTETSYLTKSTIVSTTSGGKLTMVSEGRGKWLGPCK